MKATIEIPDDLYRQVTAKSAQQGRPLQAVTVELLRRWLADDDTDAPDRVAGRTRLESLQRWFQLADEYFKDAPPGPTAREILEQDRNRLER